MTPVVEVRSLTQSYEPGKPVLDSLTLSVEAGEVVGLLGRNGAGKTTLLNTLVGTMAAQSGRVSVFGLDPFENGVAVKQRIGFVAEDQALPPYLKVRQVVEMHRTLFPDWDDAFARELGGRFSIDPNQRIAQLSKGQARQVALLCAVAHRPELLLLDEPAGGLDPAMRREFLETAIELLGREGTTVLFSSHYMGDVERIAERIVMVHSGSVLIDEPLDDVKENYTVATVPGIDRNRSLQLTGLDGCVRVRQRGEVTTGVFRGVPEDVRARVATVTADADVDCRRVPLEDLFIEIVGASR